MKSWTYKKLNSFFNKQGYQLLSNKNLASYKNFTLNVVAALEQATTNQQVDSLVFSKDRAMQLHAFLSSYIEKVSNKGRMYILYKCSNERHLQSYEALMAAFPDEDFIFIKEHDFRQQLIHILERSAASKFIFFVDDMIFTHATDFKVLGGIQTAESVLSLSRGTDMHYSVVSQKELLLPPFTQLDEKLLSFDWNYTEGLSDWTFPLGLSGYMYNRLEVLFMLKAIDFKAPNSLENAMQIFLPFFIHRKGLCFEHASCVCVHANLVQSEFVNSSLGTYSAEELLSLWERGKRIDLAPFYDRPLQETQERKFTFV